MRREKNMRVDRRMNRRTKGEREGNHGRKGKGEGEGERKKREGATRRIRGEKEK